LTSILCLALRLRGGGGGGYPKYILTEAAELNDDNETVESRFFALYNMILNYWFPPEDFDVCPKWTIPNCGRTEDFSITYVIQHHRRPFLLVENKPPSDFHSDSGRHLAIRQVTSHLDEIGPTNQHAGQLYAISAIGKRGRAFYALSGSSGKDGQPVMGIAAKSSLQSPSPECWNPDITSDDSWVALQSIVETIKGYVTQ
jgi:hypothetical protein